MRKTSKIFGLIAGIFTLVFSILFILISIYSINNTIQDESALQGYFFTMGIIRIVILNVSNVAAGILGLIAALIVNKRNTGAGIMMIIGAVLCLLSIVIIFNIIFVISIVLFICGSVYALKREHPEGVSMQSNASNLLQPARKQGKLLGIVGGSAALVIAILIVITNIGYISDSPGGFESSSMSKELNIFLFMVPAIVNFLVGLLGLTAALIINKRHTAAGVMMIIGAGICIFGFMNIISMVLLIIGSVFALKPDRPVLAPAQAPQPEQLQP